MDDFVPDNKFVPDQQPDFVPDEKFKADDFVPDDKFKPDGSAKNPDMTSVKNYVMKNIEAYHKENFGIPETAEGFPQKTYDETKDWKDAFLHGLQGSSAGLGIRGQMPDQILPEHVPTAMRIADQIGQVAGDLPAMTVGSIMGGGAGAVEGLPTGPGALLTAAEGAMAGGNALPAALRKYYTDMIQKGSVSSASDFAERLMGTTWEATKAYVAGASTGAAKAAASVAGPIASFGAELAAMTTVSKAVEGQLPNPQDFLDGAIVLGGLHAAGAGGSKVSEKLKNIYARTGDHPATVIEAANKDVQLKQDLLSEDPNLPAQASEGRLINENFDKEAATAIEKANSEISKKDEARTPEEKEVASKIGSPLPEENKGFKEKFNELYAKNIDWTDPLKVAYESFKITTGKDLEAEDNPHIQARLFAGHVDQLRTVLDHGFQDESGNFKGEGLNKIYAEVPEDDQAGFDIYSVARRALELDEAGKVPWKDFNRENAEKVVRDGDSKFADLHQRRVDFQNSVMDYGVEKGVIDPEIARKSKEQNQQYIPFNRIVSPDELTGEIIGTGKLIKKIEGSDLDLQNPRQSIYQNTAAIIRRAEINDVRIKTLKNLSYEDESGERTNDFVREVPLAKNGTIRDNQIAIFRNGKMSALEGTPLVIDSLRRLEGDRTMSDLVTKIASKFSQAVRVGTIADPGFGFRHFFRSALMSGVYTQTGQVPFYHPALAFAEFMKGDSDTYKNWLYDGGSVAAMDKLERSYVDNNLQESDSKYPFLDNAWNVIKKPFEATEAFIKMSDNLSRFTEYKRAIEQGKSRDESAFLSREVTPDFQKIGLQRSALRTSIAFVGAHINSLDRMAQAFKEDTQGTILRMSVLSGISAAVWYINKDDDAVNDLPNYKKDLYWNFHIPNTQMVFSLPKPWGPGIMFGSGVERTLDAFYKHDPNAMKGFGKSLLDSVVPNTVPTMLAPVLDQMANKNLFSGRQLVNEQQQKMLPEMQYQPYTSETAKQIAKIIGYVPGVRDLGPSADPLASPEVVENYIRGWSGSLGGIALKIADAGLKQARVASVQLSDKTPEQKAYDIKNITNTGPSSVESSIAEWPIMNEFMTRFPSMKSQPITNFYQNYDDTTKVLNSVRAAAKSGDFETAQRLASQNPDLELNLSNIAKGISTGKAAIKAIQNNSDVDPVQKRQLIDAHLFQIGSMAKMGNQMMSDFKKAVKGQ